MKLDPDYLNIFIFQPLGGASDNTTNLKIFTLQLQLTLK